MPELMRTIFGLDEGSLGIRFIRLLERWSIARADLVITVNVSCKRLFAARSCLPEKIGVVMNAPDDEIFPYRAATSYPARVPNQRFVIMYHGSLVERNGVDLAVDALELVRDTIPTAELRVYGARYSLSETGHGQGTRSWPRKVRSIFGPKKLEELAHEIEACDVAYPEPPQRLY